MRPSFHPRLINPPFDDPGLFIPFAYENRAILFDLGDLSLLSAKDILKVSDVFVTHTHMDHFIGFDQLLRIQVGRKKKLRMFGPEGFIENVSGKMGGYTWNLLENYDQPMTIEVSEVRTDRMYKQQYRSEECFRPFQPALEVPFSGILCTEPQFTVTGSILDHGIPCLGFSLNERFHVNIMKERLEALGFSVGPWLNRFKNALFNGRAPDTMFSVPDGDEEDVAIPLGELSEKIASISRGMKIAYVADVAYHNTNARKIVDLAQGADHLFIESAFLDADEHLAAARHHLTSRQAGTLSKKAGVGRMSVFHFSPRYTGSGALLETEARTAFKGK